MKFKEKLSAMRFKAVTANAKAHRLKDDYLWGEHRDLWCGQSGRGRNERTWRKHLGAVTALESVIYALDQVLEQTSVPKMKESLRAALAYREEWAQEYHDIAMNPRDWNQNELGQWSAEASEGVLRWYCRQFRSLLGIPHPVQEQ